MTGADALQEVARDARTCADDARRAWRGLQPDGAAEAPGAAAQSLSQALARAGPDITFLIDHRDELRQMLGRVAQLTPDLDDAGAERELGKLFAALPAYAGGDLHKARSHFEAAVARAPDSARTRIAFARSVAVKAQDRSLFEAQLEAASSSPDSAGAAEARDLLARETDLFGPAEAAQPIPGGPTH